MRVLYLDESGDHSLDAIDPSYPVFVLGGVIVAAADIRELCRELARLKRRLFGNAHIVLHTADAARNRNGFERLTDLATRQAFYEEVNSLMDSARYSVIACAIHKPSYVATATATRKDPYVVCLEMLVERLCVYAAGLQEQAVIVAECRGPILDRALRAAWGDIREHGIGHLSAETIAKTVRALLMRPKSLNVAGLQLADLVVSPIGRFVVGKQSHEDFHIVQRKLLRQRGGEEGLMILPKEEGQDPLRSS
jgi:hypothetical protein